MQAARERGIIIPNVPINSTTDLSTNWRAWLDAASIIVGNDDPMSLRGGLESPTFPTRDLEA